MLRFINCVKFNFGKSYLPLDSHSNTNFWPLCLPVKMATKTVIRPITGSHLYIWVERGIVKEYCLSKDDMAMPFVQCIIKQLLDSVFVMSRIIKIFVRVVSLSLRLRLITLTFTLIFLDITQTLSNNCLSWESCFVSWGVINRTQKNNERREEVKGCLWAHSRKGCSLCSDLVYPLIGQFWQVCLNIWMKIFSFYWCKLWLIWAYADNVLHHI